MTSPFADLISVIPRTLIDFCANSPPDCLVTHIQFSGNRRKGLSIRVLPPCPLNLFRCQLATRSNSGTPLARLCGPAPRTLFEYLAVKTGNALKMVQELIVTFSGLKPLGQ